MDRRELLTGAAAIALVGKFVNGRIASKTVAQTSQSSSEWLRDWAKRLPDVARVQAQAQSHDLQIPRNTLQGSPWQSEVTLLSYRARGADPHAALAVIQDAVDQHGWQTFATGWSHDESTWAKFVVADIRSVQDAVLGKLDAIIRLPAGAFTA